MPGTSKGEDRRDVSRLGVRKCAVADQRNDIERERGCWLELLRIIAAVGVIFNHTDGFYLYYANTDSKLTFAYSLAASLFCRMAVPLFLMISGSVLLGKEEDIVTLYRKRVLRIAYVLLSASAFYYALQILRGKRAEYSLFGLVKEMLSGEIQDSLWYLYLYLGIMLLLPVLRRLAMALNEQEYIYFIILQCIFSTGIPVIERLADVSVRSEIYLFNLYLFYFLAGYWLSRKRGEEGPKLYGKERKWSICLFFLTWAIGASVVLEQQYVTGVFDQSLLDLTIPVMSLSFFTLIKNAVRQHPISGTRRTIILRTGGCVFGIYLLEQAVRIQLLPLYLRLCMMVPGVVACSVYVAGTFAVALCYTLCLKKIPIIRNFI